MAKKLSPSSSNTTNKDGLNTFVKLYFGKLFGHLYEPGMTLEQAQKKLTEHLVNIDTIVKQCFGNKYKNICALTVIYEEDENSEESEESDVSVANNETLNANQTLVNDRLLETKYHDLYT